MPTVTLLDGCRAAVLDIVQPQVTAVQMPDRGWTIAVGSHALTLTSTAIFHIGFSMSFRNPNISVRTIDECIRIFFTTIPSALDNKKIIRSVGFRLARFFRESSSVTRQWQDAVLAAMHAVDKKLPASPSFLDACAPSVGFTAVRFDFRLDGTSCQDFDWFPDDTIEASLATAMTEGCQIVFDNDYGLFVDAIGMLTTVRSGLPAGGERTALQVLQDRLQDVLDGGITDEDAFRQFVCTVV